MEYLPQLRSSAQAAGQGGLLAVCTLPACCGPSEEDRYVWASSV